MAKQHSAGWAVWFLKKSGFKKAAARLQKRVSPKPAPPKATLNQRALTLARKQIGTKEVPAGSNHTKYGVWYGMDKQPWCAMFVSWVLSHSGRPFKESYVPHIVSLATSKQAGLGVIPFSRVKATLANGIPVLACYDWEHDGTADHVGFVEKVISSTSFSAIEGNTGPVNLSNGGEVMRTVRTTNLVQVFVAVAPVK